REPGRPGTPPTRVRRWLERLDQLWLARAAEVRSSNPLFDRVMLRALLDLRLLRASLHGRQFFCAGVPWFSTLFGRDAATVAIQTLPFGSATAGHTLRLLARYQANAIDAYRDAEPGKILHELRTGELERRAAALRARFERDFWSEELGCYVLARQAGGRPVAQVASNAGQVLWGGIAAPARAARVAARLLADDMFSGWGIRTLSSASTAYNPISYHLGSVWPHDNALIAAGFWRYAQEGAALRVFDALYQAATAFRHYRLPELYAGYGRSEAEARPVSYPVACSPQAWAAGAIPHALWNLLGLRPAALEHRLDVV